MRVQLVWATPKGDELLAHMARVSNPEGQARGDSAEKLIRYLIRSKHWSPFDMVNMCVEIETARDVSRQLIRHQSIKVQEFSQRYASVEVLPPVDIRPARMQDYKNRQNSLPCTDESLNNWWLTAQENVRQFTDAMYRSALEQGIAKEVARTILPEGLTPTRMYMNGTVRSWIHFIGLRNDAATQYETREVARCIEHVLRQNFPLIWQAAFGEGSN